MLRKLPISSKNSLYNIIICINYLTVLKTSQLNLMLSYIQNKKYLLYLN